MIRINMRQNQQINLITSFIFIINIGAQLSESNFPLSSIN